MNPRRTWLAAVGLLLCGAGCAAPRAPVEPCQAWPGDESASHPRRALYQQTLDDAVNGHLPGAIALIRDAEGLWMGASGHVDLEHGVPAQSCHRMPIGSVTKTMAAALLLILAEQGRLSLDASIADHLPPAVAAGVANSDRITIRMLLNHASGIPGYSDQAWYLAGINNPGWSPTQAEAVAAVRGQSLFEPGTRHRYSSTNYILAGMVVEDVTGRPFEDVLQTELLDPLDMRATRYIPEAPFEGIAKGYLDIYGDGRFVESHDGNFLPSTPRSPSAGVATDVLDLQRFVDGLFRDGSILSPAALQEMQTIAPHSEDPRHLAVGYGLGLVHYVWPEGEAWGHSGSLLGFEAYAYYFPEDDTTMVLLVNASSLSDSVDNDSVHAYLHHEVLPALRRAAPLTAPRR